MGEPRCFHVVSACRRVRTCAIALALVGTVSLVVACSGDTTEGTGIAPTMSVPMTPATPGSETTTTSSPSVPQVSLVQVFGGSVSADENPTAEFVGNAPDVDESGMAAVTIGSSGFVAGGFSHTVAVGGTDAAVWVSPDGRSWQRVADEGGVFGDAMSVNGAESDQFISDVAGGNLGVVAVGADGRVLDFDAAVWFSSDGAVWERSPDDSSVLGGDGNQFMHAVIQVGGLVVAVGESDDEAAAWVSEDGRQWSHAEVADDSDGVVDPSVMLDVAATSDGLIAVGGAGVDSHSAVWLSADGFTWSRLPDSMAGQQSGFETGMRPMTAVALGEQGVVAIGAQLLPDEDPSYADSSTSGPLVWRSADGVVWELLDATFVELPEERESSRYAYVKRGSPVVLEDVILVGDWLLAIGRYESAPSAGALPDFVTLWASGDGGVTWEIADETNFEPAELWKPPELWRGARALSRSADSVVVVGIDSVPAGEHPEYGWTAWAITPSVWIADLPAS
jgi:hypothetical protein